MKCMRVRRVDFDRFAAGMALAIELMNGFELKEAESLTRQALTLARQMQHSATAGGWAGSFVCTQHITIFVQIFTA